MVDEGATPAFGSSGGPAATFQQLKTVISSDIVNSTGGVFQFNLTGKANGVESKSIYSQQIHFLLIYTCICLIG